eukprot:CAMPEP_0197641894 /NCGR_PEP_ID=MMETSP1338-20131121/15709_1 /TAXON_ID=43686 ORGANISM="Pelagodinium beii, Strain RCC1491" /NCGR_SAMPLE_ID=MMETSP1338 /ASSEMBLY_ACC=CAM_ASM_000754 /LENGTH=329 /DNA_ID=CAMNT_0043214937 /DNA_START=75 /DNA_END=1061 /DNA_ORIENTATION=-
MVEGDGCHRVAAEHRKSLVGKKMKATSPNGKFKAGAQAIGKAGGVLLKIEVHGKNMFYFFGSKGGKPKLVVHIHFGMAGAFAVYKGDEPEVTANTRLRLETADSAGPHFVAHLSAMTVVASSPEKLYVPLVAKLGPDPLREDADVERIVAGCAGAKKSIGQLLMDQSFSAGVGNIYRTETLYEAGIHPNQPANTLTRPEVLKLWNVIMKQMQAGFKTGSIWGYKSGAACYGRTKSACGGKVKSWSVAGRTVYACDQRQKLSAARASTSAKLRRSGTSHLGEMTSAVKAENKKRKTGEGLAVQHVALKDDATRAATLASKKRPASAQQAK